MNKKANNASIAAIIFGIIALISLDPRFYSMAKAGSATEIKTIFIVLSAIFAVLAIILGKSGQKKCAEGKSDTGLHLGTSGIICGFITISIIGLILLTVVLQSDFLGDIFKGKPKVDPAALQQEKIDQTKEILKQIRGKAAALMANKEEEDSPVRLQTVAKKYNLQTVDAWSNNIILRVYHRKDAEGFFTRWGASAISMGPDGKKGTPDDVKP